MARGQEQRALMVLPCRNAPGVSVCSDPAAMIRLGVVPDRDSESGCQCLPLPVTHKLPLADPKLLRPVSFPREASREVAA